LIARIRAGDEEAFGVLFDRYLATLRSYLRKTLPVRLQARVSTSDLLQEARMVAYARLSDFVEKGAGGSFRAWLMRIVELKLREAVRRHGTTAKRAAARELPRGDRPDSALFVATGPSPSQAAMSAETRRRVHEALQELAPDYRRVIELVRLEGYTLREAAEHMGRSREATKKLYGRAMLRLTEALGHG
jgi:RNA polymerase sigma-70 factor (ECF subfamily)